MIDLGKVLLFFRDTVTEINTNEIRNLTKNVIETLGERVGDDLYHLYLIENNLDMNKPSQVGMDSVVRLLDPKAYVDNLLTANYSMIGFILPKSQFSQFIFDELKERYESLMHDTNSYKIEVKNRTNEKSSEGLHGA